MAGERGLYRQYQVPQLLAGQRFLQYFIHGKGLHRENSRAT